MLENNSNYILDNKDTKLQEVVSIPVSLYKSMKGKYFVGQTETLWVGNESNAWAGLVNPRNSDVNLYANVFTISNLSNDYLTAQIWLNTSFPEKACTSRKISPTNTALKPLPKNRVNIRFIESTTMVPKDGVNVYERIVPPNTTLVGEEDGKFIEAPGGSYTLIIKSSSLKLDKVIVAFGWWEKPICK
ncbi:hypothetical protein GKZ28_18600 [Clostridium chromiireducens]|uniref:Uncharacterized protein n=1 Tax=Clostridium chromiireducens TaxID=225345 RepID=A0A964W406_9CLOT|nr:DUF6143 family protein [Clostridium chromiireducens]MVX65693.1 hypothetical protein [Clostridium chromiireducens]